MRLVASHPSFELIYAAGEGSAGSRLVDRFPGVPAKLTELVIEKWDPATLPKLDVLFASLPTGTSADALARVPKDVKIVDIGGDHRYVAGWAYGLADVWPGQIEGQTRVANPGCFPAATLTALAPLLANDLIEPGNIVIDAKTGISGAGRGGADNRFGYAESNRELGALRSAPARPHARDRQDDRTVERRQRGRTGLHAPPGADDPRRARHHLLPRPRHNGPVLGLGPAASTPAGHSSASPTSRRRPNGRPARTSHSSAMPPIRERHLVIAMGVVDNLGKGAAGQAVQNANLLCGLPETAGAGRRTYLAMRSRQSPNPNSP